MYAIMAQVQQQVSGAIRALEAAGLEVLGLTADPALGGEWRVRVHAYDWFRTGAVLGRPHEVERLDDRRWPWRLRWRFGWVEVFALARDLGPVWRVWPDLEPAPEMTEAQAV